MPALHSLQRPVGLAPGDHVAWAVDGAHPPADALVRYFAEGAGRRERLILVTDSDQDVLAGLPDRERLLDRDQLRLQTPDQTYELVLRGDPWGQADQFAREADLAVADGFTGIRVWADVTHLAADPTRREQLLDYETAAERIFRDKRATGLCAVDVSRTASTWRPLAGRHRVRSCWGEPPTVAVALLGDEVRLVGALDVAAVPELTDSLDSVRRTTAGSLALDLGELDFLDVAGSRAIARFVRRLAAEGRSVDLVGVRSPAARVLGLFDLPVGGGSAP